MNDEKPTYCTCNYKDVGRNSICKTCGKPVEIKYTKPPQLHMTLLLIVTGGRDYKDRDRLFEELDMRRPAMVIEGGCPTGADAFAREWCDERGVMSVTVNALWTAEQRGAGPRRNRRMVKLLKSLPGDVTKEVLAFPGGTGTHSCKKEARAVGLKIRTVG